MTVQFDDESLNAPNFRRTSLRGRGAALQLRAQQQQAPLQPVLLDKTPEADFSQEAMDEREYITRRIEGQQLQVALVKQSRPMEFVPGTSKDPNVIRAVQNRFDKEVEDLINASQERVRQRNLQDFPILQDYLAEARKAGQIISEKDVENVVSWGQLNAAVDLYVKAADAGDAVTMNNIVATLSNQDTGNLEMAMIFPTLLEERLSAVASQALADPNIVDKALAGLGTIAYNAFNVLFYPASKFNEAQRATEYYQENERPGGVQGFLQGATQYLPYMAQLSAVLPTAVFNEESTRRTATPGSFNPNYLTQLVEVGGYSQREVNLATEIARRFAVGDPDPIVSVWNEQGDMLDPEVAGFFYNLMSNAENDDTRRVQDLMRQIQSVDMGNNGAMRLGASDPNLEYNPDRATKWFEYTKGAADISMQVASDPLMFLGPAVRAAQFAKWQIGRLMPGAEKAVDVLKPRTIRGVTVHTRASRYFDNLVKDLNELDGLEEAAKAATGKKQATLRKRATLARQRMSGRYNNIPEDLLETFRTSVPKNEQGQRTLEGLAQFIDSANVAWETAANKVAREVVAEGATDLASRFVTTELLETKAFQKFIADNPTIAGQMASRSQRRNLLIPQMGIIGGIRSRAINKIVVNSLPFGHATRIIDDFFGSAQTPQEIADVIEGRFVELARAKQPLTPSGIYDRFTRTFTSLPNDVVISIDTASSAKDFYRYTRQFLDKGTAAFLTDAYRTASPAARRALVISVVRSSFAARGVVLKPSQLDEMISRPTGAPVGPEEARISGINPGEAFEAVIDGPMPSDRLGIFREQKAAMARATTPTGEQPRLIPSVLPEGAEVAATPRAVIAGIKNEMDLVRSAQTVDDFVEAQPEFKRLYGELETLTLKKGDALEIQAINQRFTEWYATATSRYWQLKKIADIEDSIKEIEDALPAFRQTASGPDWIMADDVFEQEVLREMDEVRRLLDEDLQFAVGDYEIVDIRQLIGLITTQSGKGLNLPPQWMNVYERSGEIPFWWVERAWNANIGQSKASNILRQWIRTGKTELRDVDEVELNFGLAELRDEAYPYVNMRGKETKTKVLRLPWKAERSEDAVRARAEALVEDSWFNQAAPQFDLMYNSLLQLRDDYADAVAGLTDDAIRQEATERVIGTLPMRSNPIDPLAAVSDDIARVQSNRPWSPSRDRFGVEHAMHQYQIAENIRIPSAKELDDIRQNALARRLGKVNNGIGRIVDYWSWGTLFGPRFSMRNAIEELGVYFLTGGRFMDLYRGRKADTAMREITPTWQVKKIDGKLELVPRSELGMVASRMRRLGTKLQARREHANQEWFADIILPNVDQDRLLEATIAFQAGDVNAYSDLLTETIIQLDRGVGLTALSPREKRALTALARSNHGLALMDDVAAGGSAILSGRYPQLARTAIDLDMVEPGVVEAVMGRIPMAGPALKWGEYGAISPRATTPQGRMFGNWWWFRGLQAVVDGDGPIGKLAVLHLGDPKKAKEAIFDAIKTDTTWGYKETWTRLANASDDDIREFANSYYQVALRLFQKKNGDINWDLRKKFIDKDADGNTIVMWRKTRNPDGTPIPGIGNDEYMLRVNSRYLAGLKEDDVPEVILGRELAAAQQPIPVVGSIDGLFSLMDNIVDGGYGWMGRQNARISRGPLFKANYFNMVKQMQPFEDDLVKAIAGGAEATPQHRKLAEMLTDSISMDSAYNMTMAYLDNPANRSALAWRARNVARYYRATEDFYRRAGRIAKFYPDAYYRAALTYSLLDTTGFVYTDDEGNKYFAYPGNEIVQDVIANVANPFFGLPFMGTQRVDPFFLGGKVLGLSPSLDPKMAFPSMMGPLTVPMVAVFDMFPNLLGLKAALLGPYAATGAGTLWDDVKNAALPAGAKRLFAVLDEEELDTILGQAAVDTVKIMVAEGIIEANGDSVSDFMQSDAYKEAQSISVGLVFTKAIMGWLAPGAPQVYDNNVSNVARRMGITSMDSAFRKILEARVAAGDEDAWNTATSMWYAAKIPGSPASKQYSPWNSIMPFTIGGTKQADTIAAGAGVQPYDTVYEWFERGEGKRLSKLKGGPDAVGWLAPREGEFTWQAWNLVKNVRGYRVSKTTEEGLEDIFSAEGKYKEMEIRRYYNGEIEKLNPNIPEQMERIKQLNKEKDYLLIDNERRNPYWSKVKVDERAEDNQAILRSRLTSMETLLDSMQREGIKIEGAALHIQNAITIWRTFSPMINGLGRSRTDLAAKAALRAQMEAALLEEANQSLNAENFINGVINPLNYGSLRDPYELEQ